MANIMDALSLLFKKDGRMISQVAGDVKIPCTEARALRHLLRVEPFALLVTDRFREFLALPMHGCRPPSPRNCVTRPRPMR